MSASASMSLSMNTRPLCLRRSKLRDSCDFIDSIRFMSSSLDLLSRNLVGVNGMVCEGCISGRTVLTVA